MDNLPTLQDSFMFFYNEGLTRKKNPHRAFLYAKNMLEKKHLVQCPYAGYDSFRHILRKRLSKGTKFH